MVQGSSTPWKNDAELDYIITDSRIVLQGAVTRLRCVENEIESVDLSKAQSLTWLAIFGNKLKTLDLSGAPLIQNLYCNDNELETIILTGCNKLQDLYCFKNNIKQIDLSDATALKLFSCTANQITDVNLSKQSNLTQLFIADNKLSSIDLSHCPKLKEAWVMDNQIEKLDLTQNTLLSQLYMARNKISSVLLGENKNIKKIYAFSNRIAQENMTSLMRALPDRTDDFKGQIFIVDLQNPKEENICLSSDVQEVVRKNWIVYDYNGNDKIEYGGFNSVAPLEPSLLSVYPIPAREALTISFQGSQSCNYVIFDATAKVVDMGPLASDEPLRLDLKKWTPGVYFIKVNDEIRRFVVE